jgi:hypothetical protein
MARLNREQQREAREELAYRDRIDIPDKKPAAEKKPQTTMDRIVGTVKKAGAKLQEINNSSAGKALRGFAYKVNSQGGSDMKRTERAPSGAKAGTRTVHVVRESDGQQSADDDDIHITVTVGKKGSKTRGKQGVRAVGGLAQRDPGLGGSGFGFGNDHL